MTHIKEGQRPLAVVTGASSGIGLELAKVFAEEGFDLLVCADNELGEARALLQAQGANVDAVQVDLATFQGVETLVERIRASGRPVDSLCVNAGVGKWGDFTRDTALEEDLHVIALNITSSVHLVKRMAADFVKQGGGRILFTSSVAATMPGPLYAVYAASKAFIQSFSEALRNELSDANVTVTALMPGPTDTEFFARADMENTKVGQKKKDDPAQVARQGFDALMNGDDKVVGGSLVNKLQAAMARLMTDPLKAKVHRSMAEPADP